MQQYQNKLTTISAKQLTKRLIFIAYSGLVKITYTKINAPCLS